MIKYRGKGFREARQNLRAPPGTERHNVLPATLTHNGSTTVVDIVICNAYKYLGSIVSVDAFLVPEAHARVRSPIASFAPLAVTVLG